MSNSYRGSCELGLVEQDGTFVLQQGVNAVRNCVQMLVGYRNGIDAAVSKFVPKPKSKPSDSGFDLERRTKKRANGVFLAMKIKRCRSKANFAPTYFYTYGKKDFIRPFLCSSSPSRSHLHWAAVRARRFAAELPNHRNAGLDRFFQLVVSGLPLTTSFFHGTVTAISHSFCGLTFPNRIHIPQL